MPYFCKKSPSIREYLCLNVAKLDISSPSPSCTYFPGLVEVRHHVFFEGQTNYGELQGTESAKCSEQLLIFIFVSLMAMAERATRQYSNRFKGVTLFCALPILLKRTTKPRPWQAAVLTRKKAKPCTWQAKRAWMYLARRRQNSCHRCYSDSRRRQNSWCRCSDSRCRQNSR